MAYHHKEILKPPPYLHYYRDYDKYAIDILQDKKLFLKSSTDFNDPFDCNAFSLKIDEPALYERKFRRELKKSFISDEQKSRIRLILSEKKYENADFWNKIAAGMQDEVVKFGIFSFSERPDNFFLWSHYANKHNGICFAFDMRFMPTDMCRLVKVRYRKIRPSIWFFNQKDYHLIFDVKSSIWKHENEWRSVVPKAARRNIDFPDNALHAVLCGMNMPINTIESIAKVLLTYTYKPRMFKAFRAAQDFGIRFKEINYN